MDIGFEHVKFNKLLADKLYRYQTSFVNKNEEHMAFFGGNLTGVHVVRFTPTDNNTFFNDVLDVDELQLTELIADVEDVDQRFKVGGNTYNLVCMYLVYRFLNTPHLDPVKRKRAATDAALVFNYKLLTGLLGLFFKYPVNEDIAKLTYANLNFKFVLKRLGSWNALLAYRAEEVTEESGLHYKNIIKFNNDTAVVYAITDARGRLADMLKNIYAEFDKVHARGDRISTVSSAQVNVDGVEMLKDKSHGADSYVRYLMTTLHDRDSFIKHELVDVVMKLMFTASRPQFMKTLEWLSDHSNHKSKELDIEHFVNTVLLHSYEYLSSNSATLHNTKDLPGFLSKIKGVYLSSRSTDKALMEMRALGEQIVGTAINSKSENAISSIRTALFLYLDLRAYCRHHYSH